MKYNIHFGNMLADYHIHTKFFCDSEAGLESYIECAKGKNIKALCFTDHVDFNKNDDGVGYYNPDKFFEELGVCKDDNVEQTMIDVFSSFISDEISDFNSSVYYSNPDYLKYSYLDGRMLD